MGVESAAGAGFRFLALSRRSCRPPSVHVFPWVLLFRHATVPLVFRPRVSRLTWRGFPTEPSLLFEKNPNAAYTAQDRVPFTTSGWVVAHGDLESQPIAQHGLQALLPQPCSTAVAATGIGQYQQLRRCRKGCPSLVFPPAGNRVDGKGWRVGRVANVHGTAVIEHVVDAIGHGSPQAVARK